MSFAEATTNVVVGFLLALLTQVVVSPLLGPVSFALRGGCSRRLRDRSIGYDR